MYIYIHMYRYTDIIDTVVPPERPRRVVVRAHQVAQPGQKITLVTLLLLLLLLLLLVIILIIIITIIMIMITLNNNNSDNNTN